MVRNHQYIFFLFFFVLTLNGCTKYIDQVSSTPLGSLAGSVKAYGVKDPTSVNPRGILVSLQTTQFQTITDSVGNFRIDNIPAGVYNIIFSKPGFDSMIYPVHHLLGVGTDIINDAYLIAESDDSLFITTISPLYKVSITKTIHVIDTIIRNGSDTVIRAYDTTIITYDTVQNPSNLIITGVLSGNNPPSNLFIYASLDSLLFPASRCPESFDLTEDAWLSMHLNDTSYSPAFGVPDIHTNKFCDTLWSDVNGRKPFTFDHGQKIFIFVVGHSSAAGLPIPDGQYEHFFTTPFGPQPVRYQFIVP